MAYIGDMRVRCRRGLVARERRVKPVKFVKLSHKWCMSGEYSVY